MRLRLYTLLHNFLHNHVEMRREALHFTVFFLSASALWLIVAALYFAAANVGVCEYLLAIRYIPEMTRSALISVPLAVGGRLIIDLDLRR